MHAVSCNRLSIVYCSSIMVVNTTKLIRETDINQSLSPRPVTSVQGGDTGEQY